MTACFPTLPAALLRAALALALLAGLLLGLAHPPAPPQIAAGAAQTTVLELGGSTFGPSGHVLAEDFRQPQHRLTASTTPTPPQGGDKPLLPSASPALRANAAARPSIAIAHPPAGRQPDRQRQTGPPRLPS